MGELVLGKVLDRVAAAIDESLRDLVAAEVERQLKRLAAPPAPDRPAATPTAARVCEACGAEIPRGKQQSAAAYSKRRYCSNSCAGQARRRPSSRAAPARRDPPAASLPPSPAPTRLTQDAPRPSDASKAKPLLSAAAQRTLDTLVEQHGDQPFNVAHESPALRELVRRALVFSSKGRAKVTAAGIRFHTDGSAD